MIRRLFHWSARAAVAYAAVLILLIAITDWRVEINATLGFLYIFPLVLLGTVLEWWQVLLATLFCTLLSDRLDPFPLEMELARDVLIFLTLAVTGILPLGVRKSPHGERKASRFNKPPRSSLSFSSRAVLPRS